MLDGDFRDFADLGETTRHCPRVCCMSATIQPDLLSDLAGKFGRDGFSASISMSPQRSTLSLVLKVTSDTRSFITADLLSQSPGERAIIFCLFKNNVPHVANYVQSACRDRCVFQCISGKAADFTAFNRSESAIMVCTTVLAAGVAFQKVSRVYFLECSHGPEVFLQGSGRGARDEGEACIATLVTTKQQLETFKGSSMVYVSRMAAFCISCIEKRLDFGDEICKLFEHSKVSPMYLHHSASIMH